MLQDWLTEADVQRWLDKFDWDSSGDIDYLEFEALVCACAEHLPAPALQCLLQVSAVPDFLAALSFWTGTGCIPVHMTFHAGVLNQVRGGTLLDGKLEEYEAAWQAAGGTRITSQSLGNLFAKLGQPLDAPRLAQVPPRPALRMPPY